MPKVLALILGGRGTRLFPLTQVRSKPAVPLAGKYRLIDIPISNCINSGFNKIYVLTQFNSESLNRHIARAYRFDNFSHGFISILAAEQTPEAGDWFQGTADAVRKSLRHIASYEADYILILSGDQLYRMDFRRLLEQHIEKGADITIASIPVSARAAMGFGILKIGVQHRVTEFREKPRGSALEVMRSPSRDPALRKRPYLASMGIYVFGRGVLEECVQDSAQVDFGKQIIPAAIAHRKVFAFLYDGYWEDIGTIAAFYKANLGLTSPRPLFNLFEPGGPIYTHPRFLPDSVIRNCRIVQSLVSEGCMITGSEIRNSIIGIRSRIGSDTSIRRTLVMGADSYETPPDVSSLRSAGVPAIGIGERSVIQHAIVDKNARIGRRVRVLNERRLKHFDGPNYYIRDGIVIIPKGGVIADGTVI